VPTSPPTLCAYPGCGRLTSGGRCDEHRGEYDRSQRPARHRLYHSKRWERTSKRYRQRHPLCARCRRPAALVHHVQTIEARPDLAFDWSNLEALCSDCHNKEHGR